MRDVKAYQYDYFEKMVPNDLTEQLQYNPNDASLIRMISSRFTHGSWSHVYCRKTKTNKETTMLAANSDYRHHESDRLILRPLRQSDIVKWAVFFENNPNLAYLGLTSSNETNNFTNLDWSKKWINIQFDRYQTTGYGMLAVICKQSGELIGQMGILQKEIEGRVEHEIGYSLLPKCWGRGYASEMSSVLVDYAIKHKVNNRIISIIHVDNIASQKVAEKNAMKVLFESTYAEMKVFIYGRDI